MEDLISSLELMFAHSSSLSSIYNSVNTVIKLITDSQLSVEIVILVPIDPTKHPIK